ncbi:MAG: cytochrome c biogenesis protein ResB [Candidatus Omnitrophica bacterium]|nr:cytochrome c biogenesis protein ResB [Candidatus Omnitrophota bacterium]
MITAKKEPAKPSPVFRLVVRIFSFLASLRLAIFLLVSMIGVFSAGTILESLHGANTAKILVYDALWLEFLLLLLAINLTASAFSRWPWQVKHVGFVLTHLGIIFVLVGSYMTKNWMLDAQMPIEEGQTEYRVIVDQPSIYLFSETMSLEFPLKKKAFAWQGREDLQPEENKESPFQVQLLNLYPKGRMHESFEAAEDGPAAVKVLLKNSFINQEQWLIQNDAEFGRVQMGPVEMVLTDKALVREAAADHDKPYLEVRWADRVQQIPILPDMIFPAEIALEGTDWRARIDAVFQKGMIEGSVLTEHKEGPDNPAVILRLEGPGGVSEKHTVFANYPEFPTQHGMRPSASGAKILYRLPGGQASRSKSHELRFVVKDGQLSYQQMSGSDLKEGVLKEGDKTVTGWMGIEFTIEKFYPHAERKRYFTPEPNTSEGKLVYPAVQVELQRNGKTKNFWLLQDMPESGTLDGEFFKIAYSKKRKPLPFKLTLKDFKIEEYPGTSRPASFESEVTLRDDFRGVQKDVRIAMNEPLIYQGLRVFQASYSRTPGEPDVSVFAVAYDPGIFLKYAGAVIMVSGIITMFYTRRFSTVKGIGE